MAGFFDSLTKDAKGAGKATGGFFDYLNNIAQAGAQSFGSAGIRSVNDIASAVTGNPSFAQNAAAFTQPNRQEQAALQTPEGKVSGAVGGFIGQQALPQAAAVATGGLAEGLVPETIGGSALAGRLAGGAASALAGGTAMGTVQGLQEGQNPGQALVSGAKFGISQAPLAALGAIPGEGALGAGIRAGAGAIVGAGGAALTGQSVLGGGFFGALQGATTKHLDEATIAAEKANPQVAAQDYKDGQMVSGTEQNIDAHTKVLTQATGDAHTHFIDNPDGPDTKYTFTGLNDPQGLEKYFAQQGVMSTVVGDDLVVHDTGGNASSIIKQVAKENNLQPTSIKGDYNTIEGDQNATKVGTTVQPSAESTSGAISQQTGEGGGGIQNPAVSAQPANSSGTGTQQVLDARARIENLTKDDPFRDDSAPTPVTSEGKQYPGRGVVNLGNLINPETQQAARGLITAQTAAETSGAMVARDFSDLGKTKLTDFAKEFQSDTPKTGRLADVSNLLQTQMEKEKAAGIYYDPKENYLPTAGLWQQDEATVRKALIGEYAKNIQQAPGFAEHSVLKDIQAGLDAGLTLKTQSVPEILAARIEQGDKAIAAKQFFQSEIDAGRISPDFQKGMKEVGSTGYFAQPEYAKVLSNYLGGYNELLRMGANASSYLKRVAFTGTGIPGGGFTPHGLNTFIDYIKSYPNISSLPLSGKFTAVVKGLVDMAAPKTAAKGINLDLIKEAQEAGSYFDLKTQNTLGQEFAGTPGNKVTQTLSWADGLRKSLYEDPLFKGTIPAEKAQLLEARFNELTSKGIPRAEALRQSGNYAMDAMGEINYDYIFRNKDVQAAMAATFFAPTYNESHLRELGQRIPQSFLPKNLNDPSFAVYRRAAVTMAAGVTALDLINRASTGHGLLQNRSGHQLSLEMDINGKTVDIPVFGSFYSNTTAELGTALAQASQGNMSGLSQTVRSRLSGPAELAVNAVTNTNDIGQKLTSPQNTLGQNLGNIAGSAQALLPGAAQAGIGLAQGNLDPRVAALKALGLNPSQAGSSTPPTGSQPSTGSSLFGSNPFAASLTGGASGGGNPNVGTKSSSGRGQTSQQRSGARMARRQASRGGHGGGRVSAGRVKSGGGSRGKVSSRVSAGRRK